MSLWLMGLGGGAYPLTILAMRWACHERYKSLSPDWLRGAFATSFWIAPIAIVLSGGLFTDGATSYALFPAALSVVIGLAVKIALKRLGEP